MAQTLTVSLIFFCSFISVAYPSYQCFVFDLGINPTDSRRCEWGCCRSTGNPCCDPPIHAALTKDSSWHMIGIATSVAVPAIIFIIVCCTTLIRRKRAQNQARLLREIMRLPQTQSTDNTHAFQTSAGYGIGSTGMSPHLPPNYEPHPHTGYDNPNFLMKPPAYSEVVSETEYPPPPPYTPDMAPDTGSPSPQTTSSDGNTNTQIAGDPTQTTGIRMQTISDRTQTTGTGLDVTENGTDTTENGTQTAGNGAHTSGNGTQTTGNDTQTTGNGTQSTGNGNGSEATGNGTQSTGNGTQTTGNGTQNTGNGTQSTGNGTQTTGNGTQSTGNGSEATTQTQDRKMFMPSL